MFLLEVFFLFPAHYELPYMHPEILQLSAKVQMRAQWGKESLVKAAPSSIWMVWSVFMYSHLTDINKLLLILAEATQSCEFLYWLLNQQNSWLSASSSSLSGNMQQLDFSIAGWACSQKWFYLQTYCSMGGNSSSKDYKAPTVPDWFGKLKQLRTPGTNPHASYWERII